MFGSANFPKRYSVMMAFMNLGIKTRLFLSLLKGVKLIASPVIDPIKYMSPKGSVVCLSTELKNA